MTPDGLKRTENMLYRQEGYRQHPYKCTQGKWTIGIGYNLDAAGISLDDAKKLWPNGISLPEAKSIMSKKIQEIMTELNKKLYWFKGLDDVRQSVLVNMAFNLGIGGLLEFKKTLDLIAIHKFTSAATEMLNSKWKDDVGERAFTLSNMMRTGEW